MKLGDIFGGVKNGETRRINSEYGRIRREYKDVLIGTQMMQNDIRCNVELWIETEQAMLELFQHIECNVTLKQEILGRLHVASDILKRPVNLESGLFRSAEDMLATEALAFYRNAYMYAAGGDVEAFRDEALDYRIMSGLNNKELGELLQRIKEISYYVELDEVNVKHLWKIYQNGYPKDIQELLHKALINRLFQNGEIYLEAYSECVKAINSRLREVD